MVNCLVLLRVGSEGSRIGDEGVRSADNRAGDPAKMSSEVGCCAKSDPKISSWDGVGVTGGTGPPNVAGRVAGPVGLSRFGCCLSSVIHCSFVQELCQTAMLGECPCRDGGNPKQVQNPKDRNAGALREVRFAFSSVLIIRICFEFRASDFRRPGGLVSGFYTTRPIF
jgi:hypothetical protein